MRSNGNFGNRSRPGSRARRLQRRLACPRWLAPAGSAILAVCHFLCLNQYPAGTCRSHNEKRSDCSGPKTGSPHNGKRTECGKQGQDYQIGPPRLGAQADQIRFCSSRHLRYSLALAVTCCGWRQIPMTTRLQAGLPTPIREISGLAHRPGFPP